MSHRKEKDLQYRKRENKRNLIKKNEFVFFSKTPMAPLNNGNQEYDVCE